MKKLLYIFICTIMIIENFYTIVYGTQSIERSELPDVNARAAILYDSTYGRILYEKNSNEKRANASTTKMITAIVAYENGSLDDIVTISKTAANTTGSSIDLRTNDKITLDDLIKGLLIHSGNDAATAIAEYISGSTEEFAKLMNEKAKEIGARNTNFVTPHGLDDENHYSTAYDLMLIADYLLDIPYLANIVAMKSAEIKVNNNVRIIGTTNEVLSVLEGANGVKTGYTGDAGRCIVASADRNERKLIAVVLGCDTKNERTSDAVELLKYGYNSYEVTDLSMYIRKKICISVPKSEYGSYVIYYSNNIKYPLTQDEKEKIRVEYSLNNNLIAPLEAGTIVASGKILLDGNKTFEFEYEISKKIPSKTWKNYLLEIALESMKKLTKS